MKWNKKKVPIFPFLVILLLVFIAFSTFHNGSTIQQIHENTDHIHHQQASSAIYVKPNLMKSQGMYGFSFSVQNLLYDLKIGTLWIKLCDLSLIWFVTFFFCDLLKWV
jgi:regulatory protein YycI of two-component signal transduction system YycFG